MCIRDRYTDLTNDAAASLAESWVDVGLYGEESRWIPSVLVQREGAAPLASTFVSVIEPYEGQRAIESIERLDSSQSDLPEDTSVGVVLNRTDGGRDVFLYGLNGAQSELTHSDADVTVVGELVYVSFTATGLARAAVWNCQSLRIGEWKLEFAPDTGYMEIDFVDGQARVVEGQADSLVATTDG